MKERPVSVKTKAGLSSLEKRQKAKEAGTH